MQAKLKRIPPSCCKFNLKNTKVTINIFLTYFHCCHNFTVAALYYTLTGPHKSLLLYNWQWQAKLIKKKKSRAKLLGALTRTGSVACQSLASHSPWYKLNIYRITFSYTYQKSMTLLLAMIENGLKASSFPAHYEQY